MRAHYLVNRDGDTMAVPVLKMTDVERVAKVVSLRAHAEGTVAHADQLERLNDDLRKSATA